MIHHVKYHYVALFNGETMGEGTIGIINGRSQHAQIINKLMKIYGTCKAGWTYTLQRM